MIPIYVAVASLLIGLLTPLWFGRWLPPVRKLRKGAQWIDPLVLNIPGVIPIEQFRNEAGAIEVTVGDRTDVALDAIADGSGATQLSREKAKRVMAWKRFSNVTGVITDTSSPLTVQTLRDHEKCGDKIVIAHHLADWTRDLERKIFNSLVINSCFLFVLVVVFTVSSDERLRKPGATWSDLLLAVETNWPFSIVLAATLVQIVVFVMLVSDQAAKYAKVIETARPPQKPILERIRGLFQFSVRHH